MGERRGNWVTPLHEYDSDFKPETIIKGQGLCKFLMENHTNEDHDWENDIELKLIEVCSICTTPKSWYMDLVHYLQ